jgi:hypothetical protein
MAGLVLPIVQPAKTLGLAGNDAAWWWVSVNCSFAPNLAVQPMVAATPKQTLR